LCAAVGAVVGGVCGYEVGRAEGRRLLIVLLSVLGFLAGGHAPALVRGLVLGFAKENFVGHDWMIKWCLLSGALGCGLTAMACLHGGWPDDGLATTLGGVCGSVFGAAAGGALAFELVFVPILVYRMVLYD
jgi:hypothetical protein